MVGAAVGRVAETFPGRGWRFLLFSTVACLLLRRSLARAIRTSSYHPRQQFLAFSEGNRRSSSRKVVAFAAEPFRSFHPSLWAIELPPQQRRSQSGTRREMAPVSRSRGAATRSGGAARLAAIKKEEEEERDRERIEGLGTRKRARRSTKMAATTTSTTDEPAGKPPPRPGKVKRETGGIEVLQKKGPKMKLEMEGGEDIIVPPTAAAPATAAAGALASAPGKRGSVDGSSPQKKRRVARGAKKSPTIKVEQQQQQQQPDVDTDGSSAPDAPVARVAAVAAEGAVPVGGSKAKATKKQQTKSAAKKPAARTKGGISSNGAAAGGKKVTAKAKTSGDRSSEVQPPLATPLRLAKGKAIKMVLDHLYPEPPIPLDFQDNFTFLCAVMLSAQTTDGKVNEVTGGSDGLFAIAPDAQTLSTLDHSTVLEIIRPVGLAPTKAKNLINMSALICSEFDGKVPDSYEGLESLPGVGHKTASVVMSQAFGEVGFAVDTHIHRQAVRWGLTVRKEEKDVKKVEEALKATFAREDWGKLHLQLIYFGREFCPAKKHTPAECPICCWINKAGRVSSGGGNGATSADGGGEGGEGGKGGSGIPGSIEDVPAEALQSTGKKAGKHIILYRERVEQIEARNGQTRPSSSEPAKRMDKNDDSVGVKAT